MGFDDAAHTAAFASVNRLVSATAEIRTEAQRGRERERARIVAALALTLLMWASAFVVIRSVGRHLSPGPLALSRIMVGSVALGIAMLVRRERRPSGGLRAVRCGRRRSFINWHRYCSLLTTSFAGCWKRLQADRAF